MKQTKTNDMAILWLLIKKQVNEKFTLFKKGKDKVDILGVVTSVLIAVILLAVFIWVFIGFLKMYTEIRINGIYDRQARQFEVLAIGYAIILILSIFSAIKFINFSLFESEDVKILVSLPIKSSIIFLYKLIFQYFSLLLLFLFTMLPLNLAFNYLFPQSGYYIVSSVVMCFIMPFISLAVASIFSLPIHFIANFFKNKYVITFITITLLTAFLCVVYAQFLEVVKQLLINKQIDSLFDEKAMTIIIAMTKWLYPTNLIANIVLGLNTLNNWLILIGITLLCSLVATIIIKLLLTMSLQQRISSGAENKFKLKTSFKQKKPFFSLLSKEFNTIFRTPSYTFQYFSMAIIMPVIAYFCMSVGNSMINALIYIDCRLELAIFIIIIFGALTNTFCATNISREGPMFYSVKAMPFSFKQVIYSKIVFCMIVAVISNFITCSVFVIFNYLSIFNALLLFVCALLLAFAQICFATRKDFNRPTFSLEEDGEVKENNNTISVIIVLGLGISVVIGASVLFIKLFTILKGMTQGLLWTWIIVFGIAIVTATVSYWYLLNRLEKEYYLFNK